VSKNTNKTPAYFSLQTLTFIYFKILFKTNSHVLIKSIPFQIFSLSKLINMQQIQFEWSYFWN